MTIRLSLRGLLLEQFLKSGNTFDIEKAGREGRNTVKVEPYIIGLVIQRAKEEKIDVRVAPFEADWQLYGLERENLIQRCMTVDSDFVPLGCTVLLHTEKLIFAPICSLKAQTMLFKSIEAPP